MLAGRLQQPASQLLARLAAHARRASTDTEASRTLEGFRSGAIRPRIVEFQVDTEQAKRSFRDWHGQRWLSPSKLLEQTSTSIRPVLLPFWLFEASMRIDYTATLGFATEGSQDGSMLWRESEPCSRHREYPWTLGSMQIYSSYKYRRDFVEAVKCPGSLARTRPLREAEAIIQSAMAGRGRERMVEIDEPTMKQSVAWELAMRAIHVREIGHAEESLKAETKADVVRDVRVQLRPLRRRARLVYFPAYIIQYTYGEVLATTGERQPQRFLAVVSGMGENQVMGERHFNVRKAQALTGAAVGSLTLAGGAVAALAWGEASTPAFGVDNAFWMLITCASAGLAAQMAPHMLQTGKEAARAAADEADLERIMRAGLGPFDSSDEEALWVASNREWRQWEEADLWRWDADKRRAWAEQLVATTHRRALQRRHFITQQAAAQERLKAEEEREARRSARFGESASARQRMGDPTFGGRAKEGRWDFLGYYELLGLKPADGHEQAGEVSASDIKRAYRRAALKWHPDRRDSLAEKDRSLAHQRFQELSRAYEVLKDPALRKQYDSGQLVAL